MCIMSLHFWVRLKKGKKQMKVTVTHIRHLRNLVYYFAFWILIAFSHSTCSGVEVSVCSICIYICLFSKLFDPEMIIYTHHPKSIHAYN